MRGAQHWVFFDLGNVLWIDEPLLCEHWMALQELAGATREDVSFERLMQVRERLVCEEHDPMPHVTAARLFLGDAGWAAVRALARERSAGEWHERNIVVQGAGALLAELSACCHLAVAANQPTTARSRLEQLGWLRYFELVGISDEMGIEKPGARFFTSLLSQAGCAGAWGRAIMVGDRLDNDILPAQKAGMSTIWVALDVEEHGYRSDEPRHRAYLQSLRRAPSRGRGPVVVRPDATVHNLGELRDAISALV